MYQVLMPVSDVSYRVGTSQGWYLPIGGLGPCLDQTGLRRTFLRLIWDDFAEPTVRDL